MKEKYLYYIDCFIKLGAYWLVVVVAFYIWWLLLILLINMICK